MSWWRINGLLLLLLSSSLLSQIPRDTSYTVESTVAKISKRYPDLEIQGVMPVYPKSVKVITGKIYKRLGERSLPANLFSSKENSNFIGVLLIHGGGWRTGNPELMTPLAEKLAEAGYFVIVPEYRMSLEAIYPAAVEDLKDAIQWMKENSVDLGINSNKIVVMGCSAGGQLASLLGTTTDVQAIVDIDGVLAFKHPDSEEGEMAAQWLGGTYEEVPDNWKEASALSHVSKNTAPTLFLASKYSRFLAGYQEYMQVLKVNRINTEIYFLEDAPHSFWLLTPWFEPTVNYTIKFLNETFNFNN